MGTVTGPHPGLRPEAPTPAGSRSPWHAMAYGGTAQPGATSLCPALIAAARRGTRFEGRGVTGLGAAPRSKAEMRKSLPRPQEESLGEMLRGQMP